MKKLFTIILACLTLLANQSLYAFSFGNVAKNVKNKVSGWFYKQEEVVKQEIPVSTQQQLHIDNSNGNIRIKTWQQNNVVLKTVKHASSFEDIDKITVKVIRTPDTITVQTASSDEIDNKYSVDFHALVPKKMALRLATGNGTIKAKHCEGMIQAHTEVGAIDLMNTKEKVCVNANIKGSITVQQATGPVQATTNNGNIALHETKCSVLAHAAHGSINMHCTHLEPTASIRLTAYGSIELRLPHEANARLQATSERGTVLSDHFINLEPQLTKLNKSAWNQLKRNIEGTLGTGEADIILHANAGPIKILETAKG